jgi:hypothetical protein
MQRPQAPVTTALLLSGIVMILMGQYFSLALPKIGAGGDVWFTLAGAILFLMGIWSFKAPEKFDFVLRPLEKIGDWLSIHPWQVILLGVSPIFSFLASLAAGEEPKMYRPALALTAWGIAIAAALIGAKQKDAPPFHLSKKALFLGAFIAGLAFLPRGIGTERIPILLTGDEGSSGLYAASIAAGEVNNPFISGWYGFPSLFFFIPALSIHFLGQTVQAIRLVSAIAGALTVAVTYFVGRALFDKRTGAFAAIFLATLHFHIHFSRIALNNIWDGLWYVVAIGALWYGWEKENRPAFMLFGFGIGIAQYFYPSARTLFILFLAWLLLAAFFDRARLKRNAPHLLAAIFFSLVFILPLARYYLHHPDLYLAPLTRVSIFGKWMQNEITLTGLPAWRILLRQFGASFGAFTFTSLRAWYLPETPILRPLMASFFLAGLLLLPSRKKRKKFILLALWISAICAAGALSESTPAAQRYVAAAPAAALLAGYGLSESARILETLWQRRARFIGIAALALALLIGANDLYFYFLRYTPKVALDKAHDNDIIAQHLADFLRDRPPDRIVVFFGSPAMGYYAIPSIQYIAPQFTGVDMNAPWGSEENPELSVSNLFFVFLPNHQEDLEAVQASYPGGSLFTEIAADGRPLYYLYASPPLSESP